jgi:NTP pyrophosphatase (non-canonical NTP hydrolase)
MDDLFRWINEFNNKYFPDWRNQHDLIYTNAIAGETGELCNSMKKYYGGGVNNKDLSKDKDKILIECADIFIYISLLLMKNGLYNRDFKEMIYDKIQSNTETMEKKRLEKYSKIGK